METKNGYPEAFVQALTEAGWLAALHRHTTMPEPLTPEVAHIFSLLMIQTDRRTSEQANGPIRPISPG